MADKLFGHPQSSDGQPLKLYDIGGGTYAPYVFDLSGGGGGGGGTVVLNGGTAAVTQATSPWIVGGTTTTVPSGTQAVSGAVTVSGTTTTVPSGTQTVAGAVTASGTVTVTPSGTQAVSQTGSPWGVTITPVSTGGLAAPYRNISVTSAGTAIKTAAGEVYGWFMSNNASAIRFVKLYAVATAPTSTDTPALTIQLPANAAANVGFPFGIPFANGIGIRASTDVADNGSGAPSANDIIANILYV